MELRKWQRENGPRGKPPLPQLRKQQILNSQQYLSQEAAYSQDIRVQMGEQVHTELHHPQYGKNAQQRYYSKTKANNCFIIGNERVNERGPPERVGRDSIVFEPQRLQPVVEANNRFIADDERTNVKVPPEQPRRDSVVFEPQRFQPMIKANNRFITEDGRNYERPPEHPEDGPVLCGQQNFQPAINTNNHFIMEDTRNYERGIPQQSDYAATTNLQVPNDKRINRNIAEKYPMGSGGTNNVYEAQNMIREHSRQIQRNPDVRERGRTGENSIN